MTYSKKKVDLLPCPHCGETKHITLWNGISESIDLVSKTNLPIDYADDGDSTGEMFCVICDALSGGCGSSTGYKKSKLGAIALWQSRPSSGIDT